MDGECILPLLSLCMTALKYPAQGQPVPNTVSYVLSSGDGFSLQLSFTNHSLIFLVRQVIFPESLPAVTHC